MAITFVKRPTSPLYFEPIKTPPEGILYPGSDQEEEYDEEKRAKKKLRIELLAKQYLEGRGLLIQSAALRGPFDKGWVNPWASKKRKRGVHSIQWSSRVPGTEEGCLKYTELEKGSSTVKRRPVRDVELTQPDNILEKRASTARRSTEQEEHTAKRRRHEPLEEPNGHHDAQKPVDADSLACTTQQEYWLKTNNPYLQRGARKDRKSPTPIPIARNGAQKPVTPPPHTKPQSQTIPIPVTPTTQRKYGEPAGFTSINRPLVSKDRENPPANISRTRSDPQHDKAATEESEHIRVKERDLATADEMTKRGDKEVKRLSQEALRQTELNDGVRQAKRSSQKAFQPCYLGTLGKSGRLERYVSVLSFTDDAKSTAGLRASSKPPKPSPRAVPPSTYVPEFQYRYAGKVYSYGSSREDASFVEAPEEDQPRPRATSSSSSGSDSFAESLGAAQVKAGSKQMVSSHSSSLVVEDHETTSVKKNTSAMRRLTFTPSGSARVAQRRTSSRPSSSSSSASPRASLPKEREGKESGPKEDALFRTASTKSSDLPTSNGNHSRNSVILPEAQIAENALVQLSQKPLGPSTNLLETDKPSPKFPSLDEGDSYVNLSTQAAFLKAQRSFKDDILSSLKDSPTKKIEKCQAASRPGGPDVTPPASSGRPNGSVAQWNNVNSQDSDDEGPMSTQAMVDAMSPFAITTVKKHPPALQERTSFAPSPTRQKSPTPAPVIPPGSPTTAAFRQLSPLRSFNEEYAKTLPQKVLSSFHETQKRVPTESASKNTTKGRPRQPACNNCRKNKRRCIHDIFGNELPHKVTEQAIPRPSARRYFRERRNDASQPSQEDQNLEESSRPAPEDNNLQGSSHSAPGDHNLESPATTPFRNNSLSMSTSPSQNPPKLSPPIPLSHPNTTSKPTSSLTSFSIHPDGTLTETSVFQDGQQPQQDWDTNLPLDPFGLTSEEPTRSGTINRDEEAEIKSNEPAEGGNTNEDKEPESLDLNAAIDEATSFLGEWDVEAEARKEGTLSRNKEAGMKGILSIGRWDG